MLKNLKTAGNTKTLPRPTARNHRSAKRIPTRSILQLAEEYCDNDNL